jgi:phospholipase C
MYWPNTVILVTWDDWGGFYDDVLPWNCSAQGVCSGYANGTYGGQQYVYGFRVPLLVVSAWTPPGYVSGSPNQGGETQPYVHDFGSILNFTEWAFGQNQASIGQISPSYPYADYLAPDVYPSCPRTQCPNLWSLSDFFLPFNAGNMRAFNLIGGWKYPTQYFVKPSQYFPATYPSDPDNDAIDSQ